MIEILIISGDAGFPLNSIYTKPSSAEESDNIRQYFLQLRHETGNFKRNYDHWPLCLSWVDVGLMQGFVMDFSECALGWELVSNVNQIMIKRSIKWPFQKLH